LKSNESTPSHAALPPSELVTGFRFVGACTHRKPPWNGAAAGPFSP
jgi:hypothetical protein